MKPCKALIPFLLFLCGGIFFLYEGHTWSGAFFIFAAGCTWTACASEIIMRMHRD